MAKIEKSSGTSRKQFNISDWNCAEDLMGTIEVGIQLVASRALHWAFENDTYLQFSWEHNDPLMMSLYVGLSEEGEAPHWEIDFREVVGDEIANLKEARLHQSDYAPKKLPKISLALRKLADEIDDAIALNESGPEPRADMPAPWEEE